MHEPAALYVDEDSIYRRLGLDCWPRSRDATRYPGPGPIIAHPPCETWGRLAFLSTADTHELAMVALRQVRQFGGVLEHPYGSQLFATLGTQPRHRSTDFHGGEFILVDQGRYGFPSPKPTWLYVVGCPRAVRLPPPLTTAAQVGRVESMSHAARRRTPLPFAIALLCILSQVE